MSCMDNTRDGILQQDEPTDRKPSVTNASSLSSIPDFPKSDSSDNEDILEQAMRPLTEEDRQSWPGWVELESDPIIFNYILRQYGVQDVKIQEVLSLDDETLQQLPQPVFGLIFLFKYQEDDGDDGNSAKSCSDHIWFANQTTNNACASIALLNIVMNIPEIELGDFLSGFRTSTQPLDPAHRGWTLSKSQFIRSIHNSFARKMDMLAIDYALSKEVKDWRREREGKRKRRKVHEESEAAFHFVAYAPIDGEVWRLDGLQRYPVSLGKHGNNWISLARENIYQRIGRSQDNSLEFNLLSLCSSPLKTIPEKLARNIKSISVVENSLGDILPNWRSFVVQSEGKNNNISLESLGISQDLIDQTDVPGTTLEKLEYANKNASDLMSLYAALVKDRDDLYESYAREENQVIQEDEQAERRKRDSTWSLFKAFRVLAEKGVLGGIIKEVRAMEYMRRE